MSSDIVTHHIKEKLDEMVETGMEVEEENHGGIGVKKDTIEKVLSMIELEGVGCVFPVGSEEVTVVANGVTSDDGVEGTVRAGEGDNGEDGTVCPGNEDGGYIRPGDGLVEEGIGHSGSGDSDRVQYVDAGGEDLSVPADSPQSSIDCSRCTASGFRNRWFLRRHMDQMHAESVKCNICGNIFLDKYHYLQHSRNCYYWCSRAGCDFHERRRSRVESHEKKHDREV